MHTFRRKTGALPLAACLMIGALSASAQVTCNANVVPNIVRDEGDTEMLADIVLTCSGGTPTPANDPVPQINLDVILNTNSTSRVTATSASGVEFNEALLLIDEPNSPSPPAALVLTRPLLNCGNAGAPDNGILGPGICEIISTGNPAQTYDGMPGVQGTAGAAPCVVVGAVPLPMPYGCGRPNAFQGRLAATLNLVEFQGVPFDPPGPDAVRTLRITNLRANANLLGPGGPHSLSVELNITASTSFSITPSTVTPSYSQPGLVASIPSTGTIRVEEGFASAFKNRNIALTLANGTYGVGVYNYTYPSALYPVEAAQNVPGALYSPYSEAGFQWQNDAPNGPPTPNPPQGLGLTGVTTNLNYPLFSTGAGGLKTGIAADGIADSGTRVALAFVAPGETVTVPPVVYLHPSGSPAVTSGVMVLTSTDPDGAGPFTPGAPVTISNAGLAVYEVLFSDPVLNEFADIPVSVSGPLHAALVYTTLAPFYLGPAANYATPSPAHPLPTAIPRFNATGNWTIVTGGAPVTAAGAQ